MTRAPRGPVHAVRLATLPPAFGLLAGLHAPPLAVFAWLALSLDLARGFEADLRLWLARRAYEAWRRENLSLANRAKRVQALRDGAAERRRQRDG